MDLRKIHNGLFENFDNIDIIEYVGVKEYDEKEKKMIRGLTIKATFGSGAQTNLFFAEMQDDTEASVKAAEKACDEFVAKFFLKERKQ